MTSKCQVSFVVARIRCVLLVLIFSMAALSAGSLKVQKKTLVVPPLEEISDTLNKGLKSNFEYVNVEVVECPDLTQKPFTLASKGLCGKPRLVEVGGPPFLAPLVQRDKVYDFKDIAELVDLNPAFVIGAGAGPHPYAGVNCEGIFNLNVRNDFIDQHSRISKVNVVDGSTIQELLPNTEHRFALLANLLFSEGKPGPVIKVHVKKRIGDDNFIASIRTSLEGFYKDKLVGLGGVFVLQEGKAKQHVMPDFSQTPIESDEAINKWLRFYNMSAPLIAVGTLVSREDQELDLRVQHFHSFSHHGEAGHYHIDVTPDTVEYLGYFTVGEEIYRIDRPESTHIIGRD